MNEMLKKIWKLFAVIFVVGLTLVFYGVCGEQVNAAQAWTGTQTQNPSNDTFELRGDITVNRSITLNGNLTIDGNGHKITFTGGNSTSLFTMSGHTLTLNNVVIDGGATGLTFVYQDGTTSSVHQIATPENVKYITNITANGYSSSRRAITITGGILNLNGVTFQKFIYSGTNGWDAYKTVLYASGGTVNVENCLFQDICGSGSGAAAMQLRGTVHATFKGLTIDHCISTKVSTATGNVIRVVLENDGRATFTTATVNGEEIPSTFRQCYSSAEGGVIGSYSSGIITLEGCVFEWNRSQRYGGAIYIPSTYIFNAKAHKSAKAGETTSSYNQFLYNRAGEIGGGAIFVTGNISLSTKPITTSQEITLENIELIGNEADKGGGIAVCFPEKMNVNPAPAPKIKYIITLRNIRGDGNIAKMNGGALYVSLGDVADPPPHTPTDGSATRYPYDNFDFVIYLDGAELYNNKALKNGGAIALVKTDIGNHRGLGIIDLQNNSASENGGALYIKEGSADLSELKATNNNRATQNGGAIYIENGSLTLTGASTADGTTVVVSENTAANGGGVYVSGAGASITITNGTVRGNKAVKGSGVSTGNGGGFYLSGGTTSSSVQLNNVGIENNIAAQNGGGGYISGQTTVTLDGGKISGNTATEGSGGGLYVDGGTGATSSITCEGTTIIQNTAYGMGGGIYAKNAHIIASGLVERVGDDYRSLMVISFNTAETGDGGGIYLDGGNFTLNGGLVRFNGAGYRYTGGGGNLGGSYDSAAWVKIADAPSNGGNGGGVYVVNGEFTMSTGSSSIEYGVRINANRAHSSGGGFYIASPVSTGNTTINLNGGTILNNIADVNGGGLAAVGSGNITVIATEVNINNNEAGTHGGGVYIDGISGGSNNVSFKMYGSVREDSASQTGYTSHATLSYNVAKNGNGGGLYLNDGNFEIHGGLIRFNGAGYEVGYEGKEIIGTEICSGEVGTESGNGGGVYVRNGNFTLDVGTDGNREYGCRVNGNYARRFGGGFFIYATNGATTNITLAGGTVISNYVGTTMQNGTATSAGCGGGFAVRASGGSTATVTATDVYINDNTAEIHGGGVYIDGGKTGPGNEGGDYTNKASFLMQGEVVESGDVYSSYSTLSYNVAKTGNGGGLYLSGGDFEIRGGLIRFNGAGHDVRYENGTFSSEELYKGSVGVDSGNGGGVYVKDGNFTLGVGEGGHREYGCRINGNYARRYGGGFYIRSETSDGSMVSLDGGTVLYNRATSGGGFGVFAANAAAKVSITANDTNIRLNEAYVPEDYRQENVVSGYGGGVYISGNANTIFHLTTDDDNIHYQTEEGEAQCAISHNTAIYGGGVAMNGGQIILDGVFIRYNKAADGGGVHLQNATLDMRLGYVSYNTATHSGGGFYIGATEGTSATVTLGDATNEKRAYVSYNTVEEGNGGGFYLNGAGIDTTIVGDFRVTRNTVTAGNGGGIYIDGGARFKVAGGTIYRNTAAGTPVFEGTPSGKTSDKGVGGGIYLANGTFDMTGAEGVAGIYANLADYAADDMFSSGNGTSFIAIPVAKMLMREDYTLADYWYEDFPGGEVHTTLFSGNQGAEIESKGRCRTILVTNRSALVRADLVEPSMIEAGKTGYDGYVCITMGPGTGQLTLSISDEEGVKSVADDQVFVFEIESIEFSGLSEYFAPIRMPLIVSRKNPITVNRLPLGTYKIRLVAAANSSVTNWSWRFDEKGNIEFLEKSIGDIGNRVTGIASGEDMIFTVHSYVENKLSVTVYEQQRPDWLTYNHYAEKGLAKGLFQ